MEIYSGMCVGSFSSCGREGGRVYILPVESPLRTILGSVITCLCTGVRYGRVRLVGRRRILLILEKCCAGGRLFAFFSSVLKGAKRFRSFMVGGCEGMGDMGRFTNLCYASRHSFGHGFRGYFGRDPCR